MKRFYFIRHGLSEMNKLGVFGGRTDTPLAAEGREQAKDAGKAAKELTIDLIVASPLSRAHDTAKIIATEIGYPVDKIVTNKLLVERNYGSMEGKAWTPGFDVSQVEDAEKDEDLLGRAQQILDWLETLPKDNILVVSHGGIGRAIRKVLRQDSDFHEAIPNAKIVSWIED